ncbi:PH domain-containing protein [Alistipes sp. OttesenSCG-928-B03]|nr:PH domain-containing protein [Alistipes sp. OttesenSCG-928-B03]
MKQQPANKFRYNYDKRTKRLTWIISAVIVAFFAAISLLAGEGYLRAWVISIMVAVLLLYVMSIPRYITVDREALEIQCVVEMTRIAIEDITLVRKVTRKDVGPLMLLLGSYGFFGYFGYYACFRRWDTLKVYTTERENLVEIEDIYEQKYIVSCREADRLIEAVMQVKLTHAGQDANVPRD